MDPRRRARECAVQMLFQMDVARQDPGEAFPLYWAGQPANPEVREMAERLARGAWAGREDADRLIGETSEHWRVERMAAVDRNILRLAVHEFLRETGTPRIAVIDEAIELAKKFGGEDSGQFVNGVLDALRRRMEEQGAGNGRP